MKMKKALSVILASIILLSVASVTAFATGSNSGFTSMKKLSKQEIVELTKDITLSNPDNIYSSIPSVEAPYSTGKINDNIIKAGLDRLNAYRRLAGLKSVSISNEYATYAQSGAVILAANNMLSHFPSKPSGMSQEMYDNGYAGTNRGNIAYYFGYNPESGPLAFSVDLWMEDSDSFNIDRLGHRRWILNPEMGKTGFGVADNNGSFYSVLYAFDTSAKADDYDFISWPPSGYMINNSVFFTPMHAWNISLNPQKYNTRNLSGVTVEMKNENRTFRFSTSSADGYFNIDNGGYGINNSIIFLPDDIQFYEGKYTVTVKGLQTLSGQATTLTYTVDFFNSEDADKEEETEEKKDPVSSSGELGDINGDGKISAADARIVLRASAKLETLSSDQTAVADVNGDNKITAADARKILRVSAKLESF